VSGVQDLRTHNAGNRGLFTLDGTRTFIVGTSDAVVIDPGPDDVDHVQRIVADLRGAERVRILLTHGHADHAAAATRLAGAMGAQILGSGHVEASPLNHGQRIETDAGVLEALHLPGHTVDHLGFWWVPQRALFAGDLLLGVGDTTWVAGYPECVSDYLASLERVDRLDPNVIYPAHGPALEQPSDAVARFRQHRLTRIAQVRAALASNPDASAADLVTPVYGSELPSAVRGYAQQSLAAILDHLR